MSSTSTSAASAYAWVLGLLDEVGSGPPRHASQRQCPAHHDETPSLSIAPGEHGRALLFCHAGCSLARILEALVIGPRHLFTPSALSPAQHARICRLRLDFPPIRQDGRVGRRGGRNRRMALEAVHFYGDHQLLRYRHPVTGDKSLAWEHLGSAGVWLSGLGGTRLTDLPLYQERQVLMGVGADETIVVVESESSVDALTGAGIYATTWAGGAATPNTHRLAKVGADVCVIADNDPPGLRCASRIQQELTASGVVVGLVVPDVPDSDARDLLRATGRDALIERIQAELDLARGPLAAQPDTTPGLRRS